MKLVPLDIALQKICIPVIPLTALPNSPSDCQPHNPVTSPNPNQKVNTSLT
jgi:hypothetical protein